MLCRFPDLPVNYKLLRAKRASGAPWVRIFGKPMRPRKFGTYARPRLQTRGKGERRPKAAQPGVGEKNRLKMGSR